MSFDETLYKEFRVFCQPVNIPASEQEEYVLCSSNLSMYQIFTF